MRSPGSETGKGTTMNHGTRVGRSGRRLLPSRAIGLGLLSLGMLLVPPALAVDGVIEINQARAAAGGVTSGDIGGFPVSLNVRGSYRLTGDLLAAAGFEAIVVGADDVTIDLNGFTISSAGGAVTDGIGVGLQKNVEIRNGTVRGFSRHGIFATGPSQNVRTIGIRAIGNGLSGIELQGPGDLVEGCFALGNAVGFRVGDGSLVFDSVARSNSIAGLLAGANAGYRSNVFTLNNGSDAAAQVSGGLQLGTNVCGSDTVCP